MADVADAPLLDPRRLPALDGGRNFRDIGGYRTADGRRVRWGQVYRSGSLAGVTADGVAALRALGITGVCDFRTTRERDSEPYGWCAELGLSYWSRDYETSFAELRGLMTSGSTTGAQAREAMLAGYRRLPFDQAGAYGELFRRLAAGELPVVFNCSAGKDRAGTAAALVLTALGVPRETVIEDYLLTDQVADLERAILARSGGASMLARQDPAAIRAVLGCDPDYMATALDQVAASPEQFAGYLRDHLHIDEAALAAIRERLLERP